MASCFWYVSEIVLCIYIMKLGFNFCCVAIKIRLYNYYVFLSYLFVFLI